METKVTAMIFTIVDKLPAIPDEEQAMNFYQKIAEQQSENLRMTEKIAFGKKILNFGKIFENFGKNLKKISNSDSKIELNGRRQMCLRRSTFLGIFLFLGMLCLCQILLILFCLVKRWVGQYKKLD